MEQTDGSRAGRLVATGLTLLAGAAVAVIVYMLVYGAQDRICTLETHELDSVIQQLIYRVELGRRGEKVLPQWLDEIQSLKAQYLELTGADFTGPQSPSDEVVNCSVYFGPGATRGSELLSGKTRIWLWPLGQRLTERRLRIKDLCRELQRVEPMVSMADQLAALRAELYRLRADKSE